MIRLDPYRTIEEDDFVTSVCEFGGRPRYVPVGEKLGDPGSKLIWAGAASVR